MRARIRKARAPRIKHGALWRLLRTALAFAAKTPVRLCIGAARVERLNLPTVRNTYRDNPRVRLDVCAALCGERLCYLDGFGFGSVIVVLDGAAIASEFENRPPCGARVGSAVLRRRDAVHVGARENLERDNS